MNFVVSSASSNNWFYNFVYFQWDQPKCGGAAFYFSTKRNNFLNKNTKFLPEQEERRKKEFSENYIELNLKWQRAPFFLLFYAIYMLFTPHCYHQLVQRLRRTEPKLNLKWITRVFLYFLRLLRHTLLQSIGAAVTAYTYSCLLIQWIISTDKTTDDLF